MILYEMSVFIAKFAEKKKKETEAGDQAA
jgi:Sec-independent protein secretion pathway component TatC